MLEELLRRQPQPLNPLLNPRPFLFQKLLALVAQEKIGRADVDEHAAAAPHLDQFFLDELLVGSQNRERVESIISGHGTDRWERIAFLQQPFEDHGDDTVPKMAIDWLGVVPLTVHSDASFHCTRHWCFGVEKRREVDPVPGGDRLDFLDELRSDGAPSAGEGLKPSFQRESDAFQQASVRHIGEWMTVQDSMKIGVELQSARDLAQPSE